MIGVSRSVAGHGAHRPIARIAASRRALFTCPPRSARIETTVSAVIRPDSAASTTARVVTLVLVGIGLREFRQGAVEGVAAAEVGGDGDAVAGPSVGAGQVRPQTLGVVGQRGRVHRLDQRRALLVPELADVVVALDAVEPLVRTQPSMMSLAACISRWPSTTRWPCCWYFARAEERLEHRRLGLLELQEQRIGVVAAEHEHDPGARSHAAHPDDLPGGIDVAEPLEQAAGGRRAASRGRSGSGSGAPASGLDGARRRTSSSIGTIIGGSLR